MPPPSLKLVLVTTIPESLFFFSDHAESAKSKGVEVHVVSSPGADLQKFSRRAKVLAHELPMYRGISPLRDLIAIVKLWRLLRTIRPHIVHAATPKAGLIGMIAARFAHVPIRFLHILGWRFMTTTGARKWFLCLSERVACALSSRVICVSHSVREVAIAKGICKPEHLFVPGKGSVNGVDATRFCPGQPEERRRARQALGIPATAFVVGYVGRVVADKGLRELAMAWRSLRITFPTMHLLVAGRFEPQDPLPEDARLSLMNDPSVHMAGEVPDALEVYKALDVFVLPTYREGFPLVLLEAAAMRLPAVATSVTGCVDAVEDGITGTLVPPYDAAALAQAVGKYFCDEALRIRHGKAARDRVLRNFRPDEVASALWQEYEALLGTTPSTRLSTVARKHMNTIGAA